MTISLFSAGAAQFANNAAVAAALGGTSIANDLAVVYGSLSSTVGVSLAISAGYTQDVVSGNGSLSATYAYHEVVGAGAGNPTVTPSGTSAGNVVAALGLLLRGANATTPLHNIAGQSTGAANNSTPIATPALTVTNNKCLILALVAYANPATSFGAFNPNGDGNWSSAIAFSEHTFSQALAVQVFYRIQTTAVNISSSSVSISGSASTNQAHCIVSAYNAAAGGRLLLLGNRGGF